MILERLIYYFFRYLKFYTVIFRSHFLPKDTIVHSRPSEDDMLDGMLDIISSQIVDDLITSCCETVQADVEAVSSDLDADDDISEDYECIDDDKVVCLLDAKSTVCGCKCECNPIAALYCMIFLKKCF